jgi:hypothetical protein
MKLVKLFSFLLTLAACVGTVMAADNATSAAALGQFRIPIVQNGSGASSLITPTSNADDAVILRMGSRGQPIELSPFAGVCFTMRTYKVKPTERLRDNESGTTEYSTCQMGSNYKIRPADEPPVKLK